MTGHSLPYAVNCSILFTEEPLLRRPAAVRVLGFDAIELWWPFGQAVPTGREVERLCSAVEDAGVQLVALNFFAGDLAQGDRGVVSAPGRSAEFRDNVDVVAGIAARLGTRRFNALYGNRVDGLSPEAQDDLAVENLAFAADRLSRLGGTVLIEPVSGHERYPLRLAIDAIAVVDKVRAASGHRNLALLADLYHLATNGDDVDGVIADHVSRIGHVQVADAPGRHEPGTGSLPLDRQLRSLEEGGYAGWVGLEYQPSGRSADSFDWLAPERRAAARPV
jgi:hydroxypyruvate isomerase